MKPKIDAVRYVFEFIHYSDHQMTLVPPASTTTTTTPTTHLDDHNDDIPAARTDHYEDQGGCRVTTMTTLLGSQCRCMERRRRSSAASWPPTTMAQCHHRPSTADTILYRLPSFIYNVFIEIYYIIFDITLRYDSTLGRYSHYRRKRTHSILTELSRVPTESHR